MMQGREDGERRVANIIFKSNVKLPEPIKDVEKVFLKALARAVRQIVERTQAGRTIEGKSFKSYSPKYKAYKVSKKRSGKVDLTFTGQMLRSISSKILRRSDVQLEGAITIGADQKTKAIANQTGASARPFFGLSKQQINEIQKEIMEALNNG